MNNYHELERQLHSVRPRLTSEEQELVWQRISGALPSPKRQRRYARRTVVAAVLLGLFGGTATVFASNEAVPGDILYPIDRGVESARIAIATPAQKDVLRVEFANERYREIKTIVKRERSVSPSQQVSGEDRSIQAVGTSAFPVASTTLAVATSSEINVLIDEDDDTFPKNEDQRIAQLVREIKQAEKSVRDNRAREEIRDVAGKARMVRSGKEVEDEKKVEIATVGTTTKQVDAPEQKNQRSLIARIEKKLRKNEEKRGRNTGVTQSTSSTIAVVATSSTATSQTEVVKVAEPSSRWGRRHEWNGKQPVEKNENKRNGKSDDSQESENNSGNIVASTSADKTLLVGTTTLTQSATTTDQYVQTVSATTTAIKESSVLEPTITSTESTSTTPIISEIATSTVETGIVQSNITAIVDSDTVTITWQTNIPTKTELYYDDAAQFDRNDADHVGNSEKKVDHLFKLDKLDPARTYRYQIRSEDGDGNKVYSPVHEVTTI